ncbi:glycolipid transport [Seminavis robusta]|uniref:Glycolipid transport n=1 Tax=Seminavis robusta TaxID=568900 RepID=A0A9N8DVC8_9STRA|nr:glycolipid transport [Seminavis robusta]|eukprot:Sro273_g105170.1 glycolipid transport (522) ;mRNA; f:50120-51685
MCPRTLFILIVVAVTLDNADGTLFSSVEGGTFAGGGRSLGPNFGIGRFRPRVPFLELQWHHQSGVEADDERPAMQRTLQRYIDPIRVGLCRARKYESAVALWQGMKFADKLQNDISRTSPGGSRQVMLASNGILVGTGPRGGAQVKTKRKSSSSRGKSSSTASKKKKSTHESPLSDANPFFPVEAIGEMALGDVGKVFEYAVKSTQEDFDRDQFIGGLEARLQNAVQAMDNASSKSRGPNVRIPTTTGEPGDIDTFNFCAAMRILTEWRMLRQVPEGYKSFAVSMKMGHKDVVSNIGKMEEAAHDFIDSQKKKQAASAVFSPTLRDLLQFELDSNTHESLPKLKEVSGAMGLLWVRRQLHFQLAFFENSCDRKSFPTTSEAFQAAYEQVYTDYHGRTVRQIFNYSLKGAPERREVYKCMNPRKLQECLAVPRHVIAASMRQPAEDSNNKGRMGRLKPQPTPQPVHVDAEALDDEAVDQWISREMEKDALDHMKSFLSVSSPLLGDLTLVIDEFNMNDPKKV